MNEDLQKQLAEMLAKLTSAAEQGVAFAGDQIPPLVAEKIAYGRVVHLVGLLLMLGLGYVAWRLFAYCRALEWDVDENNQIIPAMMCSVLLAAGGGIGFYVHAQWAILAWVAPRLYIVEWLRTFL